MKNCIKNLIIFTETAVLSALAGGVITAIGYTLALKSEGYESHFQRMKR